MNEDHIYTNADVRYFLNRRLRKAVPMATYKRWKRLLQVRPIRSEAGEYLYSQSDINALVTLGKWFSSDSQATFAKFKEHYQLEE